MPPDTNVAFSEAEVASVGCTVSVGAAPVDPVPELVAADGVTVGESVVDANVLVEAVVLSSGKSEEVVVDATTVSVATPVESTRED